ncbi:MAG: hypothetical protein AAF988_05675 [Pseudomonadota bacterium]
MLSASVNAQPVTPAPQACDPDYWEVLSSRAWMEAEREIQQNQNLIFKPDSVFEYTCFDRLLAHTATNAGSIFSHTGYFGGEIIPEESALGLRNSIGKVVYESLKVHINDNYSHTFLGGRAAHMDANSRDTNMILGATSPGYTALFSGSFGTCQIMRDIWQTSKCANFVDNSEFDGSDDSQSSDGFYPFDALTSADGSKTIAGYADSITDARGLPTQCSGTSAMGTWSSNIASIESHLNSSFRTPLAIIYSNVYTRTDANAPGNCGYAIPTGVTVYTTADQEGTPDGVCTRPGCTYSSTARTPTSTVCVAPSAGSSSPPSIVTTPPVLPDGTGSAGGA